MAKENKRLFLISVVMLFLEILLIRWISTEVRIFAYVSNLVLLACFLGIGVGCFLAKKEINLLITFGMLILLALAVQVDSFRRITDLLGGFSDSIIWYQAVRSGNLIPALEGTVLTLFMFLMTLVCFIPLGQLLGRQMDEHPKIIEAYSLNVVASLVGIWIYNILALYYTKPWVWFVFAFLLLFFLLPRKKSFFLLAGLASLLILLVVGLANPNKKTLWSPYQKLTVTTNEVMGRQNGYLINVNNVGYMTMLDMSDDFLKKLFPSGKTMLRKFNQYDVPYAFVEKPESVLIVGAGGGNDVAGALRHGPKEIDAVEIDPGIIDLGRLLHPEKPYNQERVRIYNDDARAFFKKSRKKYDLICFGLLDSHTLSSNYNNTRLDHYVYTEESFQEARKLLKENGVLSVNFATQTEWIGKRIHGLLMKTFGEVPYTFAIQIPTGNYVWGGTMFLVSNNPAALKKKVAEDPELEDFVTRNRVSFSGSVHLTSDDWPYLYIEKASIPKMYLLIMGSLVLLFVLAGRFVFASQGSRINGHFFFLGCAFLLLEFQNVSKATLLFGSTWIVNAYIISSILLLILLANLSAALFSFRNRLPFYLFLGAAVLVNVFLPLDIFNALGFWNKVIWASLFLNLPIFFAGIIFIHSFREAPAKDIALGSNLIGAALGGVLESLSFITGIKALLLLVLIFYGLSFVFRPRATRMSRVS